MLLGVFFGFSTTPSFYILTILKFKRAYSINFKTLLQLEVFLAATPYKSNQCAWEIQQAHVGHAIRTIEMGGPRWHQQSVTWTWIETERKGGASEDSPGNGTLRKVRGFGSHQVRHHHRICLG